MSVRQQAQLAGLDFAYSADTRIEPEWQDAEWPPLLGGWRTGPASVVVNHPDKSQGKIVVVVGGQRAHSHPTNSVLLLNVENNHPSWREGPSMNQNRYLHAAVVCNDALYAMGGIRGKYSSTEWLDTIERIDVGDLLRQSVPIHGNNHWTTLDCRLSIKQCTRTAAVVQERFIVVAGAYGMNYLSYVDVIDTSLSSQCNVISGPPLKVGRTNFGIAVIG